MCLECPESLRRGRGAQTLRVPRPRQGCAAAAGKGATPLPPPGGVWMQAGHRVPPGAGGVRPPARARGSPHPHPGSSSGRGTARDPGAGPRAPGTARAPSPRDTQEPITGPRGRAAGRSCLRWRGGAHARRRRGRAGMGRARSSRRRPGVWIAPPARLAPPRRGQRGRGPHRWPAHLWPRRGRR